MIYPFVQLIKVNTTSGSTRHSIAMEQVGQKIHARKLFWDDDEASVGVNDGISVEKIKILRYSPVRKLIFYQSW